MTIRPLIIAPDPRLKTKSSAVEAGDSSISELAQDLFDTMYFEKGIGLAAVQIGVLKRVLVTDISWKEGGTPGDPYTLINPEVLEDSQELNTYKEGCLSFPDHFADVVRPKTIRVRYMDLQGATQEREFDGLQATCVQHEIDHLNGITFPDRIPLVRRDMILRKMKKMKKEMAYHAHHHVHDEHCNH